MAKRKRLTKKQKFRLRAKKAARTKRAKNELRIMHKIAIKYFNEHKDITTIAIEMDMDINTVIRYLKRIQRLRSRLELDTSKKQEKERDNKEIEVIA